MSRHKGSTNPTQSRMYNSITHGLVAADVQPSFSIVAQKQPGCALAATPEFLPSIVPGYPKDPSTATTSLKERFRCCTFLVLTGRFAASGALSWWLRRSSFELIWLAIWTGE